jgi:hypothetical protein
MFTNYVYEGVVRRDADGAVVAPVSDMSDPAFLEWIEWCEAGNTPVMDYTTPPDPADRILTKLAFRRRFTLEERIACDSAPENESLPASARAALKTMATDLALAEEVSLDDPDVVAGIGLLAQLGLITQARAQEILA